MAIYITGGCTLLPDNLSMSNIIDGNIKGAVLSGNTPHLPQIIGERFIREGDFVMPAVDKIIRRASHPQSQWVLYTGIKTWEKGIGEHFPPEQRGLFLGLGTTDADNNAYFIASDAKNDGDYVSRSLVERPPLMGLMLLNTSTASHLSQHLNIMGDNAFFSPQVDAGGHALLEGYYSIKEKRSQFVLCGGNAQKISAWYYLAYERLIGNTPWLPAEAASFTALHHDDRNADSELVYVNRTIIHSSHHYQHFLSQALNAGSPYQIIHVGRLEHDAIPLTYAIFPEAVQFHLDKAIGYTGPAAVFIASNLAIELHQKSLVLDNTHTHIQTRLTCQQASPKVLILVHGLEKQCIAVLLDMNMPGRELS
ncbi:MULTISPECIES: hypothetical protein [Xenorhabdus]|uniref:hypothetical protein n=1 Tax=Xenorhabdus TaxID=626 RepID=UPI000647A839|nr:MULTISPECIES: hypothetical protein [Xenorhabdus]MBC8946347.1 hypothetical protein [Xenorhabdus indica]